MDVQTLISFVKSYLNTKNEDYFIKILEEMSPLIKKYTYKLYYLEPEDCIQELNIAIFEAVVGIKQIDNDYACFSYLLKSIKHKFCKLYATSVSRQKQITEQVDLEEAYIINKDFELDNILFHLDLDRQFASKSPKEKQILNLLLNGYSDVEIGKQLGMSRQYINRFKKQIFNNI